MSKEQEHPGMEVLRTVLRRLRWDKKGGYPCLHNGKWDFVNTDVPEVRPEELDALFDMVGIVPDEIKEYNS